MSNTIRGLVPSAVTGTCSVFDVAPRRRSSSQPVGRQPGDAVRPVIPGLRLDGTTKAAQV